MHWKKFKIDLFLILIKKKVIFLVVGAGSVVKPVFTIKRFKKIKFTIVSGSIY